MYVDLVYDSQQPVRVYIVCVKRNNRNAPDVTQFGERMFWVDVAVAAEKCAELNRAAGGEHYGVYAAELAMVARMSEQRRCICPRTCDCPSLPEEKTGGFWIASETCPVHNEHPVPHPECAVHGRRN